MKIIAHYSKVDETLHLYFNSHNDRTQFMNEKVPFSFYAEGVTKNGYPPVFKWKTININCFHKTSIYFRANITVDVLNDIITIRHKIIVIDTWT